MIKYSVFVVFDLVYGHNACLDRTSRRQYSSTESTVSLKEVEGCHPVAVGKLKFCVICPASK